MLTLYTLINENHFDIEVYPNPTDGMLYFSVDSDIEVFSLAGERILEQSGVNYIDLGLLAKGLYTLRISDHEGASIHKILLR